MEPIALTQFGETLLEYPGSKTTDESKLSGCIGIHEVCNCWVDLRVISKTHNILKCRSCGLRIPLLKSIDTYGKLRQWCAAKLRPRREHLYFEDEIG